MGQSSRRTFLGTAGLAASSGLVGLAFGRDTLTSALQGGAAAPDYVLNPVEVSGAEARPIIGRLPGARRMYVLPANAGEYHLIGGQVMTRAARPIDTANVYELAIFTGRTGAAMPRHLHRSSHAAFLVLGGEVHLELDGRQYQMMRGDFANIPPGTPHGWTLVSDRAKLALYTMNDRVGAAFMAMGTPHSSAAPPATGAFASITAAKLAEAADHGDFQILPALTEIKVPTRVTNLVLPAAPGPYVLLDGGGERFGGNTFLARNANTTGNFLFIMTEGGPGPGVPAHFHARHFENFLGVDGETLGWAYGQAVSLKDGDYFQAPPRNLHGFKLAQAYNRFAAFLTPGIFENFFTRGGNGQNGVGRQAAAGAGGRAGGPEGARGGTPGAVGAARGGPGGAPGAARGGNDMFRTLMMSAQGPDGYPLDVHGPTLPLPPQDPIWLQGQNGDDMADRVALLAHAQTICGLGTPNREITPELRRAMALKPKAEEFL